ANLFAKERYILRKLMTMPIGQCSRNMGTRI
ncbi:hypothetical protein PSYJA_38399, partial [Pseudomonas syringae pv. japonica str. M301072]